MALNVFYFMDNNYDIWAYRYKKGSTGVLARRQMERGNVETLHPGVENHGRTGCNVSTNPRMAIYNIHGELIANLKSAFRNPYSAIEWDASGLPPGLYFLRATAGVKTWSAKMVLAR
jgi:hypothetical protein